MTISELITQLNDFDGDAEVRLAVQPNWPFENSIAHVISREEMDRDSCESSDEDNDADQGDDPDAQETNTVVYIAEGGQLGYLSGDAWSGR